MHSGHAYRSRFVGMVACAALLMPAVSDAGQVDGQVLDEQGRPADGVEVGFYWTANEWHDEKGERRPILEVWRHVGGMRTSRAVVTDADGKFTLEADPADQHRAILAIDAGRRRGGTARADEGGKLTVRLELLTRVHGRIRRADTKQAPDWSAAYVLTPEDDRFPLTRDRLAHCGSYDGRVEFLLPPGRYLLEGYGSDENERTDLRMPRPLELAVAAGGGEIDLGELVVRPWDRKAEVAKADAPAGDYRDRYGRSIPQWHATGARGIAADVKPSDLRGRWVLLYFWATGCLPCLREGVPTLMEFADRHRDARDRFTVLTIFEGREEEGFSSVDDLSRWLAPIERRVWKRDLTLPVLLDTTYRTRKSFGFEFYGTVLLIDPAGNLVRVEPAENGDILGPTLERLAAELRPPIEAVRP